MTSWHKHNLKIAGEKFKEKHHMIVKTTYRQDGEVRRHYKWVPKNHSK